MALIPCKTGGRPSKQPRTREDKEQLIALYQTHTAKEIGDMYDVNASTVRSWISRMRKEVTENERK